MRPYFWRDMWASAADITPSHGYHWPSEVDGRYRVPNGYGSNVPSFDRDLFRAVKLAVVGGFVLVLFGSRFGWMVLAVAGVANIVVFRAGVDASPARSTVEYRRLTEEIERLSSDDD